MSANSHSISASLHFPDGNSMVVSRTWTETADWVPVKLIADGKEILTDFNTLKYLMDSLRTEAKMKGKVI